MRGRVRPKHANGGPFDTSVTCRVLAQRFFKVIHAKVQKITQRASPVLKGIFAVQMKSLRGYSMVKRVSPGRFGVRRGKYRGNSNMSESELTYIS